MTLKKKSLFSITKNSITKPRVEDLLICIAGAVVAGAVAAVGVAAAAAGVTGAGAGATGAGAGAGAGAGVVIIVAANSLIDGILEREASSFQKAARRISYIAGAVAFIGVGGWIANDFSSRNTVSPPTEAKTGVPTCVPPFQLEKVPCKNGETCYRCVAPSNG